MKLIDILVQELPKLGGWPIGADSIYQNAKGHLVGVQGCIVSPVGMVLGIVAEDVHRSVTREQYEAALSARKPEWDGEGVPPVGADVQCICNQFPSEGQEKLLGKILYSGEYTILHTYKTNEQHHVPVESVLMTKHWSITPIRSEADKKKEEAIKAIFDTLAQYDNLKGCHTYEGKADYMFSAIAAGKIPHIRID